MILYEADDPLVLNGTYDQEGYKPGERERERKAKARMARQQEGDDMAKKKKPAARTRGGKMTASRPTSERLKKPATVPVVRHRTNTIKGNGALPTSREVAPTVTIGEAMRRAVAELGEVVIDADMAPAQMRQLSECYEQVAREQAAYNERQEQAKIAKKSLDSATALLLEKVRTFTHATPLPLFDGQQREADQANMLDSVESDQ